MYNFMPSDKVQFSDIVHDLLCYKFDTEDHSIDNHIRMKSFVEKFTELFFDTEDLSNLDISIYKSEDEEGIILKLNNDFTEDLYSTVLYELDDDDDDEDESENNLPTKISLN